MKNLVVQSKSRTPSYLPHFRAPAIAFLISGSSVRVAMSATASWDAGCLAPGECRRMEGAQSLHSRSTCSLSPHLNEPCRRDDEQSRQQRDGQIRMYPHPRRHVPDSDNSIIANGRQQSVIGRKTRMLTVVHPCNQHLRIGIKQNQFINSARTRWIVSFCFRHQLFENARLMVEIRREPNGLPIMG